MTYRVTGNGLLTLQADNRDRSASDLCRMAGYTYRRPDGTERFCFIDFYEALLDAKRAVDPEFTVKMEQETNEEYDAIVEACVDLGIPKGCLTEDVVSEIIDLGLTPETIADAYQGMYSSTKEFAQRFMEDIGDVDTNSPVYFAIDWGMVWDHSLRYDYYAVEVDYCTVLMFSDNNY